MNWELILANNQLALLQVNILTISGNGLEAQRAQV